MASYLSKVADFNLHNLHLLPHLRMILVKLPQSLTSENYYRFPGLSGGPLCTILRLAVLTQYRLVTDRQIGGQAHDKTTAYTALA